ncbi:MAG: LysM peptidoglycan-binding domain-containing protein [Magnetospirillum sp.]|nr:LysM peptidoglycan-binding domain-containing protein [Magnetospirillum sp.]
MPLLLAACDPNFQGGGAPVTRGLQGMGGCGGTVTTYSGDTVYSIARRCNVSVRELIEANRLQAPYQINAGMVLRIPGGSGEYVVQRGDTLLVLARKLGVDFQTLARTNGKSAPYTIFVGEKLRVPGSFGSGTQLAQASPGAANTTLVIASPNAVGGQGAVVRFHRHHEPAARPAAGRASSGAGAGTPPCRRCPGVGRAGTHAYAHAATGGQSAAAGSAAHGRARFHLAAEGRGGDRIRPHGQGPEQ